jgi:hypothetical protein
LPVSTVDNLLSSWIFVYILYAVSSQGFFCFD